MPDTSPARATASTRPVVLVTGAAGLIGTKVAEVLRPRYEVVGLDVERPAAELFDDAHFVEADLTSDSATANALELVRSRAGGRLASVIHLAAYYDFSGEPSPLYRALTVEGTRRLLRGLRARCRVQQFVFASSLLVMKPSTTGEMLDERSAVQGEWDYPQSKLDAEAVIEAEHGDVPVVVMRMAGTYDEGGHSPPLSQQIWRIREKKLESFVFPGNRSRGQSFVHLDDVGDCFGRIVDRRRRLGSSELFLVGEPEVMSYGELQDRIGELVHGRAWPTLRIPAPVAKVGAWMKQQLPVGDDDFIKPWMVDLADAHYPVSIARARRHLGWEPKRRLHDTLPPMIARLECDAEAWYAENGLPAPERATERGARRG